MNGQTSVAPIIYRGNEQQSSAFRTEAQYTITLPRHRSGRTVELQCGCEPRIVQSAWFMKPGEGL